MESAGDRVTWTYDAANQLSAEHRTGVSGFRHTFVYDPAGNRTLLDKDSDLTTFTYDAANRLRRSAALSGRTTYVYDAAGNQRTIEEPTGDVVTNTWSYENQNTLVEQPTGDRVTLTYNGDKMQVAREDADEARRFEWDKHNLLLETDDLGTPLARNTHEPDEYGRLVSREDLTTSEPAYYHYDALGSTAALSDASEVVGDEYQYKAWGEQTAPTADPQPYRWVGELGYRYDDDTGRHNLRRRDYDSHLAQFLSQDPPDGDDDPNKYRYANNQPLDFVDPAGTEANPLLESAASAGGSALAGAAGALKKSESLGAEIDCVFNESVSVMNSSSVAKKITIRTRCKGDGNQCCYKVRPHSKSFGLGTVSYELVEWRLVGAMTEEEMQAEKERAKHNRLLAQATEDVLSGEYFPKRTTPFLAVTPAPKRRPNDPYASDYNTVRDVCPNISPEVIDAQRRFGTLPAFSHNPGDRTSIEPGYDARIITKKELHSAIQSRYADLVEKERFKAGGARGMLQFSLDLLGLIPGVGGVFDAINAGIYYYYAEYGEAALSLAGIVPLLGEAAVIGKHSKSTVKVTGKWAVKAESAGDTAKALERAGESGKATLVVKADDAAIARKVSPSRVPPTAKAPLEIPLFKGKHKILVKADEAICRICSPEPCKTLKEAVTRALAETPASNPARKELERLLQELDDVENRMNAAKAAAGTNEVDFDLAPFRPDINRIGSELTAISEKSGNEAIRRAIEGATPRTVASSIVDPKNAPVGGPKNGSYVAYHGTSESGAASLTAKGIDAKSLQNPNEFNLTVIPKSAASFGADEVSKVGGTVKLVRYEIPEDLFHELLLRGHIKLGGVPNSIVLDQVAQDAINKAMGF